jgi:hypothetical protein
MIAATSGQSGTQGLESRPVGPCNDEQLPRVPCSALLIPGQPGLFLFLAGSAEKRACNSQS